MSARQHLVTAARYLQLAEGALNQQKYDQAEAFAALATAHYAAAHAAGPGGSVL